MCCLIWNSRLVLISLSLKPAYQLLFCHACLYLLVVQLAVAQCSSFVKHYEWIPNMYFFAMFECCSITIFLHLDGYLLFIADRCHICFACHFQTVHPIPAIFISISTEITSPFQWHTWISMLRTGSFIPCQILHMHHISHPAYHTMFASCCLCIARGWLCSLLLVVLVLGRVVDEYVTEEPVEYAYEDQVNSDNFAGKMIIPSKSLISLLC